MSFFPFFSFLLNSLPMLACPLPLPHKGPGHLFCLLSIKESIYGIDFLPFLVTWGWMLMFVFENSYSPSYYIYWSMNWQLKEGTELPCEIPALSSFSNYLETFLNLWSCIYLGYNLKIIASLFAAQCSYRCLLVYFFMFVKCPSFSWFSLHLIIMNLPGHIPLLSSIDSGPLLWQIIPIYKNNLSPTCFKHVFLHRLDPFQESYIFLALMTLCLFPHSALNSYSNYIFYHILKFGAWGYITCLNSMYSLVYKFAHRDGIINVTD